MTDLLVWLPFDDRPDLVAEAVQERLTSSLSRSELAHVELAEIDARYAAGDALCEHYGVPRSEAANCLIITATRGDDVRYAACLVPPGARSDLNGTVRRHLGARRITMTPHEETLRLTGMEYGSITAVGLPKDWRVLVDSGYAGTQRLVMGSGVLRSKLRLATDVFVKAAAAEFVAGLVRP